MALVTDEIPRSYRYLVDDRFFIDEDGNNLAPEIFRRRFVNLFIEMQTLLENYGLLENCTINDQLLWKAVLDYFADVARMKAFQKYEHAQLEKVFSYETFWLLRNHPIQIDKPDSIDKRYVHINEYILSFLFIKKLAKKLDKSFASSIQIDDLIEKFENHELADELRKKLYYTFKFRTYTQQSLLLLIEGFMTAAEFTLQVT